MFARLKSRMIRYFFFGSSITSDGYSRLVYLGARFLVFAPLSLCATIGLGLYSLFRPVKILVMRCDRSKVSFVVEDLEVALRLETNRNRISGHRPALIFALLDKPSPNKSLTDMYSRVVTFLGDDRVVLRGIIRYVLPIPRVERRYLPQKNSERLDIWSKEKPILSFSAKEKQDGLLLQKNLLGDTQNPFICIGIAEQNYYKTKHSTEHPVVQTSDLFSYMPSWENYLPCARELLDRGYCMVRMGQYVDGALPENADPRMVDYASKSRTEFGDIWLLGNCRFVVAGGGPGLYWPSSAFNRPTVLTDSYNLYYTPFGPNDLILPQLARSRSEKRLHSFSWIFANGEWAQDRSLIEGDIEIVKNTSEEITEVVLEMDQRLNGTWVETDEDIELQNRFQKLRDVVPKWRIQQSVRIGADFLRRYRHLL